MLENKNKDDVVAAPSDPTVAAVFEALKEELTLLKQKQDEKYQAKLEKEKEKESSSSTDENNKETATTTTTKTSSSSPPPPPPQYIRVHDLKQAIKKKKLFSEDGGPLPSKVSILRFLKQHTDKYFDVTGNGMYVAPFGTFSLADKVQPDYNPSFDSSSVTSSTSLKKQDPYNMMNKNKNGEDEEEFTNLDLDDEDGDDNEWDVELDLDTDEQAETNRVVQESFELEQLEELEEQGKLDRLLKSNFSAVLGDTTSSSSKKKKKGSKTKLYTEKQAAEIFKLFASEVAAIPSAPDLNPAALISAQDFSSNKKSTSSLLSISEILRMQQEGNNNLQHHQQLSSPLHQQQQQSSSSSPITRMAAPPPPLPGMINNNNNKKSPGSTSRATPPPLSSMMMQMSSSSSSKLGSGGGIITTGWGSHQQNSILQQGNNNNTMTSSSTFGTSGDFLSSSSSQTQEMLSLFVECIPTFFVPVMLLRVNDNLRRATGNRDIGRVVRQYHYFFDFQQQEVPNGSSQGSSAAMAAASLKNLLVKMKSGLRHPKLGEADKLYAWALPSASSSSSTTSTSTTTKTTTSSTKNNSNNNNISSETLESLKKQQHQQKETKTTPTTTANSSSSSSSSTATLFTVDTPRIAPIRLATDQIDQDCQTIMNALDFINDQQHDKNNNNNDQNEEVGKRRRRPYSATCEELVEMLVMKNSQQQDQQQQLPEEFKNPNSLFKWLLQRPRMFSVFVVNNNNDDDQNNQKMNFEVSLRPLDVAPGSLQDFDLLSLMNDENKKSYYVRERILEKFSSSENTTGESSSNVDSNNKTADALVEIYNKMRAGMWMDVNSLKRKLKTQKFLLVDDVSTADSFVKNPDVFSSTTTEKKNADDSCSSYESKKKILQETLLMMSSTSNQNTKDDEKNIKQRLHWFRFFGKSVWVDNVQLTAKSSSATTRFRKFTGSADLDDVEHFALNLLHSQIKQKASKEKMDFRLKKTTGETEQDNELILSELPKCVGHLFLSDLEVTFKVLKAQPNKFIVKKDENKNNNSIDSLMVSYASLFRKG